MVLTFIGTRHRAPHCDLGRSTQSSRRWERRLAMSLRLRRVLLFTLPVLLLWSSLALASGVQAPFSLEVPTGGPFPSDRFTVADSGQATGLRVRLASPN